MPGKSTHYQAYLLRIWPEVVDATGQIAWRCSLENARTRQRRGFESLPALFAFLESTIGDHNDEATE